MKRKGRKPKELIHFSTMFEPSMKRRVKTFLEGDTHAATLTRALLFTAALGGVIAVGIMAPNLFKILRVPYYTERNKRLNKKGFVRSRRACYQLKQRGLIERDFKEGSSNRWRLTLLGEELIKKLIDGKGRKQFARPTHWDGKMRVIVFDIPDIHTRARNIFRSKLKIMGCYPLQRSVWVYPFPCRKELLVSAAHLHVQDYIEVYTMEDFDNKNAMSFFRRFLHLK